jgi:hypothetical protein
VSRAAGLRELLLQALERVERPGSARDDVDPDRPLLFGYGPAAFSTCTDLVPPPRYYADVNGYYRGLGVGPHATRREMRDAFLARDGHRSRWLTYAMAQLLDLNEPGTRDAYDRCLPWQRFDDRYLREEERRRVKRRLGQARQQAGGDAAKLDALLARLAEDGFEVLPEGGEWGTEESLAAQDKAEVDQLIRWGLYFPYAHYLWRSAGGDEVRLLRWQRLLVSEAARLGLVVTLAVGYLGRQPHPYVVARVGLLDVVFLHEDHDPTPGHAAGAIRALVESRHTTETHRTHASPRILTPR